MDFGPLFFWTLVIAFGLWLIIMPIAIIINFLYGLGVEHRLVRPHWIIGPRVLHLMLSIIGLIAYAFVLWLVLGVPVTEHLGLS